MGKAEYKNKTQSIYPPFSIKVEKTDIPQMFKIAKMEEGYSKKEFIEAINNPILFNNGACTSFSYHFGAKIKDAIIRDSTEMFEEIQKHVPLFSYGSHYHSFIEINGMYYDFECLSGVEEVGNLPFFIRLKSKL